MSHATGAKYPFFQSDWLATSEWLWRQNLVPKIFEQAEVAISTVKWNVLRVPPGKQVLIGGVAIFRDVGVGLTQRDAVWMLSISSDTLIAASWWGR